MKLRSRIRFAAFLLGLGYVAMAVVSCRSLVPASSPQSIPVILHAADTNTPPLVGWLQVVKDANLAANPTASRPVVDIFLAAGIALASALSGYYIRHKAAGVLAGEQAASKLPPKQPVS